jgi:hypothetical protein
LPFRKPEPITSSNNASRNVRSKAIAMWPALIDRAPITTAVRCPIQRSAIRPPNTGVK